MMNEIAERYGQGLFELAKEDNTLQDKKKQSEQIQEILKTNSEVELFLKAVKITKEEKKNFVTTIFGQVADKEMVNMIKLLVDRGRITYLPQILEQFDTLANQELGIVKAVVHSARNLSQEDLAKIQEALVQKTNKTVILENQIDPSLIAGIKVTVGNNVTDITMKTKIEHMKNVILKGGQA